MNCPECKVKMTFHEGGDTLWCRYCDLLFTQWSDGTLEPVGSNADKMEMKNVNNLKTPEEQIFELLEKYPELHSPKLAPALVLDKYQLTTVAAHYLNGTHNTKVVFDYYFRKSPFSNRSFALAGGLHEFINYIKRLRFQTYQINHLRKKGIYTEEYLQFLKDFRFTGNIRALKEGTLTGAEVRGVIIECTVAEAHLIETRLLNNFNPNTLWLTLSLKMCHAAKESRIWEGGMRRAQGIDASVESALMGYLGGMMGTSNQEANYQYGIPDIGTHPHAWVQFFETEFEAFLAYYRAFPKNTSLLVDTFDILKSGIPNAIRIARIAESEGNKLLGVRIDSGDLAYYENESRKMLEEAGFGYMVVTSSDGINEKIIITLKNQGIKGNFLVGTDFVTSAAQPALGGVFKLVAVEDSNGEMTQDLGREDLKDLIDTFPKRWIYKIKISNNPEKTLLPGIKKTIRFIDNKTNKHISDYICSIEEVIDITQPFTLINPLDKTDRKTITDYRIVDLMQDIFINGKLVYQEPTFEETRLYVQEQKSLLQVTQLRDENPSPYWVNISDKLWNLRIELIEIEKAKIANN